MGSYNQYRPKTSYRDRQNQETIHPIWRGIGFIFMIGVPFFAYVLGLWVLQQNQANNWFPIPAEYLARGADPLLYVKIGLTIVLSILLYVVVSFVGVFLTGLLGHRRYGPLDAPPERPVRRRKL